MLTWSTFIWFRTIYLLLIWLVKWHLWPVERSRNIWHIVCFNIPSLFNFLPSCANRLLWISALLCNLATRSRFSFWRTFSSSIFLRTSAEAVFLLLILNAAMIRKLIQPDKRIHCIWLDLHRHWGPFHVIAMEVSIQSSFMIYSLLVVIKIHFIRNVL